MEWAEFVGNYYGTPIAQVEKLREEREKCSFGNRSAGATQVREKCPDAVSIFIIHQAWKSWKIAFAVEEANRKKLCSSV